MLESAIERKCVNHAEKVGCLCFKVQRRSYPDRLIVFPGTHDIILVEFKKPGETPRKDQKRTIRKLRDRGFDVFVIDSFDEFRTMLEYEMEIREVASRVKM